VRRFSIARKKTNSGIPEKLVDVFTRRLRVCESQLVATAREEMYQG
jgi:hypothetical protein